MAAGKEDSASASLRSLARRALDGRGIGLCFPPPLEVRYRQDEAPDRARHQRFIVRAALLLYAAIGLAINLTVVAHPAWPLIILQLVGVPALVVLLVHRFFRADTPDAAREAALFVCCLAAVLCALLPVYARPTPVTTEDLVLAALPLNFVLMFIRLRFRAAAALLILSFSAYVLMVFLRPDIAGTAKAFPIVFMLIICLPPLVGIHALERASRRLYLHGLLQRLDYERIATENATLANLTLTDALTGVANRRRLDQALQSFCAATEPHGALLLLDIDGFKAFNDRHGHLAGDACLRDVARRLAGAVDRHDLLARFGGEEFAVLLPEATLAEAVAVAERLRLAVAPQGMTATGPAAGVTVSIGVAEARGPITSARFVEQADSALYVAKRSGRNCVRSAEFEQAA